MEEKEKNKVWLGDDGVIYLEVVTSTNEEEIFEILKNAEEIIARLPRKAKIMIDIQTSSIIHSSKFRKECGERIRELYDKQGFEKAAIFCINIVLRTIASFIIIASGVKNIKIFKTKEQALKWLKES